MALHSTDMIRTSRGPDGARVLACVAILVALAAGEATVSLTGILYILGKAVSFFLVVAILGKWVFPSSKAYK